MIPSGKAKVAAVLGWPIGHSLSPRLHGFWLQQYGIDGAYIPLAIEPENFERVYRALPGLGFAGGQCHHSPQGSGAGLLGRGR